MAQRPTACVTGASSGIGEQFARQLAARGHDLVVVARSTQRLDELARELEKFYDVACEVIDADLSTGAGRARVLRRLAEGDVETMVNAAGFGSYGDLVGRPAGELEEMVQVNVLAVTLLSRAAAEAMVRRQRGRLCNVASIAAFAPGAGAGVYHATKAYVTSFTEALHEEVRPFGVHVTALCPGFTPTAFQERAGLHASQVPSLFTTKAAIVARRGLAALERNDAVCVPGTVDRLLIACSRLTPAGVVRRSTAFTIARLAGERGVAPLVALGAAGLGDPPQAPGNITSDSLPTSRLVPCEGRAAG